MPGIIWEIREKLRQKALKYNDKELEEIARKVDEKLISIKELDKILKLKKEK